MIPLAHCAPAALADLLRGQPMSSGKLTLAWRSAVGPAVDRATRISLAPGGTLEVRAADSFWRREIERSADLIRARLEGLLGRDVVRNIRIAAPRS